MAIVALIYKCLYVVAHLVFRQCFEMWDVYVKMKMEEKEKRGQTLNKGNLALIFRLDFGECPLYFSALQNSQNVFKVFILTVTIRSPQVQLSDTRTVTKTARKSTRSYSFIAHSLATQEFPVIVDFIYWFSLHSCQNGHVLFVTQYDNNTFLTHSLHMVRY